MINGGREIILFAWVTLIFFLLVTFFKIRIDEHQSIGI